MKKGFKEIGFMVILAVIIIGIVAGIIYLKKDIPPEVKMMKCIAANSTVYVSNTCGHCATQKEILGENIKYFNLVYCDKKPLDCSENGIKFVPTWIIKGKKYEGTKSLEELKNMTGC